MIKLHASYAKKIPADRQYSSEHYSASMEIEVADEVSKDPTHLHANLDNLWRELKKAVELQIRQKALSETETPINNHKTMKKNKGKKASNKQIKYLLSLGKDNGMNFNAVKELIQERFGKDVYELEIVEASEIIDEFKGR